MVGFFTLLVNLLIANNIHFLQSVLQPVVQPFERPAAEEGQHFPESVLDALVFQLDLFNKTFVVGLHQGLDNAVLGADRRACSVVLALTKTSLTERLPIFIID